MLYKKQTNSVLHTRRSISFFEAYRFTVQLFRGHNEFLFFLNTQNFHESTKKILALLLKKTIHNLQKRVNGFNEFDNF